MDTLKKAIADGQEVKMHMMNNQYHVLIYGDCAIGHRASTLEEAIQKCEESYKTWLAENE